MKRSVNRVLMRSATLAVAIGWFGPRAASAQQDHVPRPVVDLRPGTANYKFKMEVDGHVVIMDVTRTTRADKGTWVLTQTTSIPGDVQTDEITVEKRTLLLRRRVFRQGDALVDLQFKGHSVTGIIADSTRKISVNTDMGDVIFADGGGGVDVLAALPLSKNYSTEFRNFNIGSQQVKSLQLRVIDDETVTVPAGRFDTWKVLITSLDGASDTYVLWVDKRAHRVVKMGMSAPDVGNLLATGELTK